MLAMAGYQGLTLQDYLHSSAEKKLAITFDDGYENTYTEAFPILEEYGFKATVFLIYDYLGQMNLWDANIGGVRFRHLDAAQVQRLLNAGWEAGSHGLSHKPLISADSDWLQKELFHSKVLLEKHFGVSVKSFAFPFGYFNLSLLESCRMAGYRVAVGFKASTALENLAVPERLPVYRWIDSPISILAKIGERGQFAYQAQKSKGSIIRTGAALSVLYQKLFRG
ncbi:MAG TPA: polysaccharide deacetylase family protein [Candidatus Marinimicrobia bacterium]|nr:polysaccharide deacetylase family protein [Candidatus Neomarinimicrobiota bacterium]